MKTVLQKNGDVTVRFKKNEVGSCREIVALFLEAYVDPDDLKNLTEQEKLALVFDGQLVRAIKKAKHLKKKFKGRGASR